MNVNKYFSFAIVVFLMAVPLVLTSCGKDNILDEKYGRSLIMLKVQP